MSLLTLPLVLNMDGVHLSDEQFYQLCLSNPDLPLERDSQGALIVRSPMGGEGGSRELELGVDLALWNRETRLGKVFSSPTLFKLPGGGDRSPDAAWVALSRWQALTAEQRQKFPPIAPDFVMELRSRTDRLEPLQQKMQEYVDCGVRLGWLVNPQDQQVEIYRQGEAKAVQQLPADLSGESVLPGFCLRLDRFEED